MATHSSTLAWKIRWMEEPGGLQSMGSLGVGHDWATSLSLFTFMHWRRKEMATHSNVLTWRIPGMGEPGRLPSMGSHRVRLDWSDLAATATNKLKVLMIHISSELRSFIVIMQRENQIRSDISQSVMSDSLRPHELQHSRPPCPSPTPGVHPNSCPSSQWCHPAISSSVVPFSSCP